MVPDPKLAKYLDSLMQADVLAWRDSLFIWLLRSTKAVTWGLILEGPELFHEISALIRHWWFKRRFHFSLPERHVPELAKMVAFVGWVLITAGVAGEWYTEAHIEDVNATIQSFMDRRLEEAENKAAFLNLRASVNELEASRLRKDAAALSKRAEGERLARVKIEARVAWRRLSDKEQIAMAIKLGMFPPNSEGVSLWTNAGDIEAATFAIDIANSLQETNAVVQPPGEIMQMRESGKFGDPIRSFPTGVSVLPTKDEVSQRFADRVVEQLNARGFDAVRRRDPPFKDDKVPQIELFIYPRPEGPQGEYKLQAEREGRAKKTSR
jgi:hypothetical protein